MEKNIKIIYNNIEPEYNTKAQSTLTCFLNPVLSEIGRRYRMAIIVCPGGGYGIISEREADAVALRYQAYGLQAFVLRYRVGAGNYKQALTELSNAIDIIRSHSGKWDIDPEKIAVCGFSAGGHLALSVGCLEGYSKPNALCLCYPVVTAGTYQHSESIQNCLADSSLSSLDVSLEFHIHDNVPPVFVWHNTDDKMVSVMNSILLVEALTQRGIPYESHFFSEGNHGVSLCDGCTSRVEEQINETCGQWFDLSLKWLRRTLE